MKELIEDIKYYVDLRVKRMKLTLVEHLSALLSKAASFVVMILCALMALLVLTGALIAALATWINSVIWAFVIVGGVYVILAIVMFLLRDRLFTGSMIKMFSRMFFQENAKKWGRTPGKGRKCIRFLPKKN